MPKLAVYQTHAVDETGAVIEGAKVEIAAHTVGNPLAALFEDRNGVTPEDNPLTTDADGYARAYMASGAYRVRIYVGNPLAPTFERIWPHVAIGTAAEYDASNTMFAYVISISVEQNPPNGHAPPAHIIPVVLNAVEDATDWYVSCGTAPTAQVEIDLEADGDVIATAAIGAGETDGEWSIPADVELPAGTKIQAVFPNPADATLADVSMTIMLRR